MHAPTTLTAVDRRVRHLHVRAADAEQARRLAIDLGDALHIAFGVDLVGEP